MIFFGALGTVGKWERFSHFSNRDGACVMGRGALDGLHVARLSQDVHGQYSRAMAKAARSSPALRVPVTLLVTALLCCGFFPQVFVRKVAPTFGTSLSANTSHFANMQRYTPPRRYQRPGAAAVTDENASQPRRHNDLATK